MHIYKSLGGEDTQAWIKSIEGSFSIDDVEPALGSDEIKVLGLPYGGPENGKDASGQWFSPMTEFYDGVIPTPAVYYTHGAENGFEPELVGAVTGSWYDKSGKWFKVKLDPSSSRYGQLVQSHMSGSLRASSGAVPASVTVDPITGHIDSWLVGELSMVDLNDGYKPVNAYAITKAMPDVLFEDVYDEPVEELGMDTNALIIMLQRLLNLLTGNTVPTLTETAPVKAEPAPDPMADDTTEPIKAEEVTVSDSKCLACEEAEREAAALRAEIEAESQKCQKCPDAIRWTRTMFKAAKISADEAFGFIERFTKSDDGFAEVQAEIEARTIVPTNSKAFIAGGTQNPTIQPSGRGDDFKDEAWLESQRAMHIPGYQKKS